MPDAPSMEQLCSDLAAEHEWLLGLVVDLSDDQLATPTPAEGWTIADQLTHLAFFDERAVQAAVDPEGFSAEAERAIADFEVYEAEHLAVGRAMSALELVGWFVGARRRVVDLFASIEPRERLAWYGPPMSARSAATARFMETWSHSLDVADALAVEKPATDRVRHVCELGVRTRGWSYAVRELAAPDGKVEVILEAPSGETWQWESGAPDGSVRGSAIDFAMVVTQRRALADTALRTAGTGTEWMAIAQCYAGPPGRGRSAR